MARYRACMIERIGRWLSAPLNDHNMLSDSEFALCMRLRLGLPLVNNMPDYCPLCKDYVSFAESDHLMYCSKVEHMFIDRHDDIVQTLKRIANEYTRARAEPPADRRAHKNIRPDLLIRHAHGTYYTDVRVLHPCAPTYVDRAARFPQSPLRAAAAEKTRKYSDYVALQRGEFHPFIVSTFGSMGYSCASYFDLIRKFAADANPSNPMAGPEAVCSARAAVAVAIQRAVSRAALQAIFSARVADAYRRDSEADRRVLDSRALANAWLNNNVRR